MSSFTQSTWLKKSLLMSTFPFYLLGITTLQAQTPPIQSTLTPYGLPKISVIGNMLGTVSESPNTPSGFNIQEIEISYSDTLHPNINANIITSFHAHEDNEEFSLEEAYLDITDTLRLLSGDHHSLSGLNFNTILGRKRVSFGTQNTLHPEQWAFVTLPTIIQETLGEEGFTGNGIQFATLLPLPLFTQLEIGVWKTPRQEDTSDDSHHEHTEGPSRENPIYSARLRQGTSIHNTEIEYGLSALISNPDSSEKMKKSATYGLDFRVSTASKWTWTTEWIYTDYWINEMEEDADELHTEFITKSGLFSDVLYSLNRSSKIGIRLESLETHSLDSGYSNAMSLIIQKRLTELTKLKVQYSFTNSGENIGYFQLIFGMGPHSHTMQ